MKKETSRRKANSIFLAALLAGLLLLYSIGHWWPEVVLVFGVGLFCKQYLRNRFYDITITCFVFVGLYLSLKFKVDWQFIMPVIFALGGGYLIFKEFFLQKKKNEAEDEEERNLEIGEEQKS